MYNKNVDIKFSVQNKLKVFGSKKSKDPQQESQNRLRSPMSA